MADPPLNSGLPRLFFPSKTGFNAIGSYYSFLFDATHKTTAPIGTGYFGPGIISLPFYANDSYAYNGYYDPPGAPEQELNGSVTSSVSGQAQSCYKWFYLNSINQPLPPPTGSLPPGPADHQDFLVKTLLLASASYDLYNALPQGGLTSSVTVGDSFGELLQNSASSPAPIFNQPGFYGYHLVRVGFDSNGIATVNFSGSVGQFADDEIPYHIIGNYPGTTSGGYPLVTNGSTDADCSGSVAAGSKQDSREVTLTRNGARQVKKMTLANGQTCGEWVDPDGTGHGDTIFSHWTFSNAGKSLVVGDNINWQIFTPVFGGTWPIWSSTWVYPAYTPWYMYLGDPNDPLYSSTDTNNSELANTRTQNAPAVTWAWSPNESDDWELFGKWSAPDGMGANWSANGISDPGLYSHHQPVTEPMIYNIKESVSQHFPNQNNLAILDGATATATYFLTFHDPVDGWHTNGPSYETDPLLFPNAVAEGQPASQPAGATIQTGIPKQLDYIDYGPGVRAVGGILTTGAAVFPLLIGDAATGPWGVGITGIMIATGFQAGLFDPKEPKWTKNVPTDFGSFQSDIANQVKISNGTAVATPFGAPNYVLAPSVPRFADTNRANALAAMNLTQQQQYWVGTGPGGTYTVSATDVLHQIVQPYAAYQFDTAGLIVNANNNPSLAFANVKFHGALDAVRTWTWVSTPLPK